MVGQSPGEKRCARGNTITARQRGARARVRDAKRRDDRRANLYVHHFLPRASRNTARTSAARLAGVTCPAFIAATRANAFIVILLMSLRLNFHAAAVMPRILSSEPYRPVESAIRV